MVWGQIDTHTQTNEPELSHYTQELTQNEPKI